MAHNIMDSYSCILQAITGKMLFFVKVIGKTCIIFRANKLRSHQCVRCGSEMCCKKKKKGRQTTLSNLQRAPYEKRAQLREPY